MSRVQVAWEALQLDGRARTADARANRALSRAGASLRDVPIDCLPACATSAAERLRAIADHEQRTSTALAASFAADCRDFARVGPRLRWFVVARGWIDRWIARSILAQERRRRTEIERELGRLAHDGADEALRARVPPEIADEVAASRRTSAEARAARAALLEPFGGRALTPWAAFVLRHVETFARFVVDEVLRRILLRPPALAGLIVGWWVAESFTDWWLEARAHEIFGVGRTGVSSSMRHVLTVWTPILVAALCAYVGSLFETWMLRRYGTPDPSAPDGVRRDA